VIAHYAASALWGLALLAACVGWGRLVAAALGQRERAHVGLALVWGFAAVLALGGWLCLFGLAERSMLAALVAVGTLGIVVPRPQLRVHWSLPGALAAVSCAALLALTYATGCLDPRYQPGDDHVAYFLHAKQILETGTLLEPFSSRRMASYGGQSFLHAWLLVVAPVEHLNLLDKGVCRLAVGVALIAWALARPKRSLLSALAIAFAVCTYPGPALNTSSIYSGVLAFAGLWMTLAACRREPGRPIANGILTGLVAAATLPLRQSYGLACALVVLLEHASRFRTAADPRQGRELLCAAGSALLCVGGWALLQQQSTGTAFFPLLVGFSNPEWGVLSADSFSEFGAAAMKLATWLTLAWPLALCGLVLLCQRGLRPLAFTALVASVAHAWLLAHAQPSDIARYTTAFVLPAILFATAESVEAMGAVRSRAALRDWRLWLSAGFLLALLWQLPPWARLTERARILRNEWRLATRPPSGARVAARYEQLQSSAPAGSALLVMLEQPYLLDLRRNAVASLDLPGGASPPPGLSTLASPQQVVEYFRAHGYERLAAVRPERSERLYRLETWTLHAGGVRMNWQSDPADAAAWQVMGRTVVRFFRQLEEITAHCRLAYDNGVLVMIDLSQCRFDP
jgi:hypothetical protein